MTHHEVFKHVDMKVILWSWNITSYTIIPCESYRPFLPSENSFISLRSSQPFNQVEMLYLFNDFRGFSWNFFLVHKKTVSQGSTATHLRCGGLFSGHSYCNFPLKSARERILKSVNIWRSYGKNLVAYFFRLDRVFLGFSTGFSQFWGQWSP